jgi:oxygen-independent coproporphyrinogen-3 oxidase
MKTGGIERATVAAEQAKVDPLGLYLHVPFCASTCDYCAFYQIAPTSNEVERFLGGIEREAGLITGYRPIGTVFWGGGTPGLLSPADLGRLAQIVRKRVGEAPEEWTVELAPASVTEDRLIALREAGVTRISLGVQSFQPALLEALGRRHSRRQIDQAYDRIRSTGFPSVNLDLMFALPGQSESDWVSDLRAAVALAPDHLSTYCLTFEEDTALWLKLARGACRLDPEREARFYEAAWAELGGAGYLQYEISNYARPGHACRHNLNTWRMWEWIGLGPSAASQFGGWRGGNIPDLDAWLRHLAQGERATEDRRRLTPELLAEDALIFGLRMNEGVDWASSIARWPDAPWNEFREKIDRLTEDGLAVFESGRIALTKRGRLLADAIGAELLSSAA